MAAVLPIKITSAGKRARMVAGTDYLDANVGGTGQVAYTTGDLLYASGAAALSKLGIGATGTVLTVAAGVPSWAAPVAATEDYNATADATLIAGNAVYMTAAGHVGKAKADAAATAYMVGLAKAAISSGVTGDIKTCGTVTLTTGQWDALCGTSGGLTYNVPYFLSAATAGLLTATAPNTTGQECVPVGIGMSATVMKLNNEFDPITV